MTVLAAPEPRRSVELPPQPVPSNRPRTASLRDALWPHLLFVLAVTAVCVCRPVPTMTEWTYLALLKQQWNPDWIVGDWALSKPDPKHLVFNLLCGWPTLFLPVEAVAWIGRLLCWGGSLWFLFRIGQMLGLSRRGTSAALVSWLVMGQSLFGGEWAIGGFEAKTVAYVFLFASLDGFLRGRRFVPSILLGLTFSLHPAVGLWSGLAIGGALLATRTSFAVLARMGGLVVLFALPGAVPLLLAGTSGEPLAELRFQAVVRMPFHLDPSVFDRGAMIASVTMLAFNLAVAWRLGSDGRPRAGAWRVLAWVQVFAAGLCGLGMAARVFEKWNLLIAMPFRFHPLVVPLAFWFTTWFVFEHRRQLRLGTGTILLGGLALASLGNPIERAAKRVTGLHTAWTRPASDSDRAYRWVAENTPRDAVLLAAPQWEDAYLLAERPLVAAWGVLPLGHMTEWRERIEALRGDDWSYDPSLEEREAAQRRFDARTEAEVLDVVNRYGGDYLVGRAEYSFPVVHRIGDFRIYELPEATTDRAALAHRAIGPTRSEPR